MFDNDDIRYSRPEQRPPWELSTSTRLLDSFSFHGVDELSGPKRCNEVEKQKISRIRAAKRRDAAQQEEVDQRMERFRREQQKRQAVQRRLDHGVPAAKPKDPSQMDEVDQRMERFRQYRMKQQTSQQADDHKARRYDYSATGLTIRRKGNLVGVFIVLAIAFVFSGVIGALNGYMDASEEPAPAPEYGWEEEEDSSAEDSEEFWGGFGADDYFGSGEEEVEEYPASSKEELPRAELVGPMELDIQSEAGHKALSYQELYALCIPSTVSITVYSELGVGTGTGIVMTEDGYILTCEHVIADSSHCEVMTWDDKIYEAELVGADVQTDLAVLKIDAEGLTAAEFGNSDELVVGDEAIAIGDPLGTELRGTMTNGIISAINRNVVVSGYSMTLLQTTAALNSGNSGGPLINIYGQVVGVNNMKMISTDVTVEGLGFAVPTSVIRSIVPQLTADGRISRPVLGITCYSINAQAAEAEGYPCPGLLVASVNRDSDAYAEGLRVDDLIWAIEGKEVDDVSQVKEIIEDLDIGDQVTLSVIRFTGDGLEEYEEFELQVELMDQSEIS